MAQPIVCGNPLFLEWAEEIYNEASAAGAKCAPTYRKACASIKSCPIRYVHPKKLTNLKFVGDSLAKRLEKKWKAYYAEKGEPLPEEEVQDRSEGEDESAHAGKRKKGDDGDEDDDENPKRKKKRATKPKIPKIYVPKVRSGPYAIFLGLISALPDSYRKPLPPINPENVDEIDEQEDKLRRTLERSFLAKDELLIAAQPHCDSSFTHSESGGFYTAWNSMKGLVTKGLVAQRSNPPKFYLTVEGWKSALAVHSVAFPAQHVEEKGQRLLSFQPSPAKKAAAAPAAVTTRNRQASPTTPLNDILTQGMNTRPAKIFDLPFTFVDEDGAPVKHSSDAKCRKDPDTNRAMLLVRVEAASLAHPSAAKLRKLKQKSGTTFEGYMLRDDAPDVCPGLQTIKVPVHREKETARRAPDGIPVVSSSPSSSLRAISPGAGEPSCGVQVGAERMEVDDVSPALETREASREESTLTEEFSLENAVVYPAGTYDIILVMDAREIKNKRDDDFIRDGLREKRIAVEVRALSIGDTAWIARSRNPAHAGELRECVLDYVVERKRLDDLVSSIRDGRYDEQKHRLSNSCLRNIHYIIENYQVEAHKEKHGLQIATAKSQTQVTNGFYVKETHKPTETIEVLRMMTEVMKEELKDSALHVIPPRHVARPTYAALQTRLRRKFPDKTFHTTFETFQALNSKSASKTLRDTFAKMLLCVKGMSAERVAAVIDVWDTPIAMWQAVKQRERKLAEAAELVDPKPQKGKRKVRGIELFFADAIPGQGRAAIGDALSKEMYAVFCT